VVCMAVYGETCPKDLNFYGFVCGRLGILMLR
jgi:hypothetical protein